MYAVIQERGKQYRVAEGDTILLEATGLTPGEQLEFGRVVMLADGDSVQVGRPVVENAKVLGEVVQEEKGPKITTIKYRRRKNSRTKMGHRQRYTRVRIGQILAN